MRKEENYVKTRNFYSLFVCTCHIMTIIIIRVANAKAAIVPGGFRKDVLHILTDFVVVVNDMPYVNPH